ncbi:MAG TPA: hypothetical protein VD963_08550 [Phycisphaerales bacterium]|nr:hypothetical protein [Phycisphaerales bacterium]
MILSLAAIGVVGIIAWVWLSRGFFSALIHMICVLVAGAVAFGVWEPLAFLILEKSGKQWLLDSAYAIALAVPFAATVGILRLAVDKLLPANADLDNVSNMIGGGACGVVAGVITSGVLLISIGHLRLSTEFLGYRPMGHSPGGSVIREQSLWVPVDRMTAGFYSYLSRTTLRTGTPLAMWRPEVTDEGPLLRVNFPAPDGGGRTVLKPTDVEIMGRYTVGRAGQVKLADLLTDSFDPSRKQNVTEVDGDPAPANSYLEGFVVLFKAGAREKEGKIVVGNSQVRLVAWSEDGTDAIAIHPIAVISQAEGDKQDLGRWRFDARDVFIASPGAAAEVPMAFEFVMPRGYQPVALYVRGVRFELAEKFAKSFQDYPDIKARDKAVTNRQVILQAGVGGGPANFAGAVKYQVNMTDPNTPVRISQRLPGRDVLSRDNLNNLEVNADGRIQGGTGKFLNTELSKNRTVDPALRVANFAPIEDAVMVQIDVGQTSPIGLLTDAAANVDPTGRPTLVDTDGNRYPALGYVYRDTTETHIQYSPGRPVARVTDLPSLSRSRPDQELALLFVVSKGVKIQGLAIGDTGVTQFNPPIETQQH